MSSEWRGVEVDYQPEERVRVCIAHRRICAIDEKRDRVLCPMGHDITSVDGGFAVMTRSKAEALLPQGGTMVKAVTGARSTKGQTRSIESAIFVDGAGWRLRITLRVNKGRYEVFVWHLSPDAKAKKSGILASAETELDARGRFVAEVGKARNKGWTPALNRRGGGGLKELPEPQAAKAAVGPRSAPRR